MGLKIWTRRLRKKIAAPFDRLGRRVKTYAERFVVKTISKHGLASRDHGGFTMEAGNQLLAFLRANARQERDTEPSFFQPVAIGNGLMLIHHPYANYMYADTKNVVLLPQMVFGEYQVDTTIALERTIAQGDCVILFNALQGYHLLTAAHLVGPTGHVSAVETSENAEVLRLNVRALELEGRVQVVDREIQSVHDFNKLTVPPKRTIVVVCESLSLPEVTQACLVKYLQLNPDAIVVYASRTVSGRDYVSECSQSPQFVTSAA